MKVFSSVLVSLLFFFSVAAAVVEATIPEDASSGPGRRRKLGKKNPTQSPTSQSCSSYTIEQTCKNAGGCQWAPVEDGSICMSAYALA